MPSETGTTGETVFGQASTYLCFGLPVDSCRSNRRENSLAVTLWKLAINVEYRTLAQLMGIGRSIACPKHESHARY